MSNKYTDRWRSLAYDSDDAAMMLHEASEAESYGERTCSWAEPTDACKGKGTAIYRPAVGWWCLDGNHPS